MHGKLFDEDLIRRRNGQRREAPVLAEIRHRLSERGREVSGKRDCICWVNTFESVQRGLADGSQDVVLVDMVLPLVEDVPVFMLECVQMLRPDGLLLATTLGTESFREFRDAWAEVGEPGGHVVPLTDVREAGALLQRLKLALPVVDRDVMTVTFPDFATLYASLRAHGAGNFSTARRGGLVTPRKLRAMEAAYVRLYGRPDGRIPVTLEVIYLHGFKPDESQPAAAKRGSGKVSLVRILAE